MKRQKKQSVALRPVGSTVHLLSVLAVGVLLLFVAMVILLIVADVWYLKTHAFTFDDVWNILTSDDVQAAIRLSLITSAITLGLVLVFSVPIGYALSRYKFPGHSIINTLVDVPIVLPPVVIGLSLLAFFGTEAGDMIKAELAAYNYSLVSWVGIVLCQFMVSISYCVRSVKASFDAVDQRLEHLALSLGATPWGAFRQVTLPMARTGLLAGAIMAWARAIGVFGPLMVFVGTGPRVQVMPTMMWLELSIGNIEKALAVALVAVTMAGGALAVVHWLVPGRKWV